VKVAFEASFVRDLKKIRDQSVHGRVEQAIQDVKNADTLQDIPGFRKLRGYDSFYRIRIGDYRIGLEFAGSEVVFVRILHRKNVYRYFP
jgi:mRNA interferase RelE/StbE